MEKMNCEFSVDLVNIRSLEKNYSKFDAKYDSEGDTLYLYMDNPPPAVSVDCNGLFWLRVNPENGDIVGVEIEDYRKVFLGKYNEWQSSTMVPTKPRVDTISRELASCFC